MKYAIVTVAVVLLVTFGAEHQFDLGSYLASPPLRGGLASRTDLLHVYGPGCVRLDQNPPGVPQWEHHVYAVPDEGVWIVATVVARGEDDADLVGVSMTSISPCEDAPTLVRNFHVSDVRGVKLGDPSDRALRLLGRPTRTTAQMIGTTEVRVTHFHPEPDHPEFSINVAWQGEKVVAIGVLFSE